MSTAKLSVSIVLPGSTMVSSQECEQNPNKSTTVMPVVLETVKKFNKKENKVYFKRDVINVNIRKTIPALQVIQMSEEAYEHMISNFCPEWFGSAGGPNRWKKMSANEKLNAHLNRLCESFNGLSYSYTVFND